MVWGKTYRWNQSNVCSVLYVGIPTSRPTKFPWQHLKIKMFEHSRGSYRFNMYMCTTNELLIQRGDSVWSRSHQIDKSQRGDNVRKKLFKYNIDSPFPHSMSEWQCAVGPRKKIFKTTRFKMRFVNDDHRYELFFSNVSCSQMKLCICSAEINES